MTSPVADNEGDPSTTWTGVAIGYDEDGEGAPFEPPSGSIVDEPVTVRGAGSDISGTSDSFFYVFTELEGDGSMQLMVESFDATTDRGKAGIMIRDGLHPEARNALLYVNERTGVALQARAMSGEETHEAGADPAGGAGGWLRLTRIGDQLLGERSADGETWTNVGSYDLGLSDTVLIGMAVTSSEPEIESTAKFKSVRVGPPDHARGGGGGPKTDPDPEPDPEPEPAPEPEPDPEPTPVPDDGGDGYDLPPATLFVSPSGSDGNTGRTAGDPLRTLKHAASLVEPGDVVYLRGGVYSIDVRFRRSGTQDRPIVWASYPGEWAILDGSHQVPAEGMERMWVDGASWNEFVNFEVRNGPQQGIYVYNGASDNVFHGLVTHGHHGSGIQNVNAHRNLYAYIVAYNNYDRYNIYGRQGDDADGIGLTSGNGNHLYRVVAFDNSDDGIDLWKSTNTLVEESVTFRNGRGSHGNGTGIKAGGGIAGYHVVRSSLSFNNRSVGFTSNSGTAITFVHNTSYGNSVAEFIGHDGVTFRNNVIHGGVLYVASSDASHNSWNLGIGDPRFVSTNPEDEGFLALSVDSPAIDAGMDVGLPYEGTAPDLGALPFSVVLADRVAVNEFHLTELAGFASEPSFLASRR